MYFLENHQFRILEIKSYRLKDAKWTVNKQAKVNAVTSHVFLD